MFIYPEKISIKVALNCWRMREVGNLFVQLILLQIVWKCMYFEHSCTLYIHRAFIFYEQEENNCNLVGSMSNKKHFP
jgi:hypothetical protein